MRKGLPKILVTGGAGFIGSEFVRQCVNGPGRVVVVDKLTYAGDLRRLKAVKEKIIFYKADICNRENIDGIFRKERPDFAVHFAAESHVDRSICDAAPFLETNIKGTQVLLDASRKWGLKKFVHISTDEVYGEIKKGQFFETSSFNPNSPYSVSKAASDMLVSAHARTYGLPAVIVRPSNNYGPWQYPEKLIPVVIRRALSNKKVPVYAKGLNVREWLHVCDSAAAILVVMQKGRAGHAYNIGSGEERRNIDTVKAILKLLGKPESLIDFVQDRPGHDIRYSLNTRKIRNDLGWQAKIKFIQGLEDTVKWYLKNRKWVDSIAPCQ